MLYNSTLFESSLSTTCVITLFLSAVVMVDRGANMDQLVAGLRQDLLDQGLEVHYRDWIGILQCYSPKYHSQVLVVIQNDKFKMINCK